MRDDLTREGEVGELRVQLNLTEQGGVVSVPQSTSTDGYDLIYDHEGSLLKIQVKSVKPNSQNKNMITVPLINRKNSSVAKNDRGQTHRYAEKVDFIAVHVKGINDIFYLPQHILPSDKSCETFLLPEYEGRSGKIKLNDQYRKIKFSRS